MAEKPCNVCFIRQLVPPPRRGKSVYDAPPYESGVTAPPMGWSSWNCFRNEIDEEKIVAIADALVKTGLAAAGYRFVNLDDNWHSSMRDKNGDLQGDLVRFPHGIGRLIEEINAKGLKVGLYSSNGTLTCEDLPACFGNEERDAYTIAKWGAEFFKYDFCHHHPYSSKAPLVSAVEWMKLSAPDVKITVKAEDAILGGKATVVKDEKLPAGSYVKGLDKNGGILLFDEVRVAEEGEYAVTVVTKKRGEYEKFLVMETNGEAQLLTIPSCKKYNFTARVQTVVTLKKGGNVVKLYNPIERTTDGYVYQYRNMGKMLKKATERVSRETHTEEKPITYSICEWGWNRPWRWGKSAGNQWRTTLDIRPWWWWIKLIYARTVRLYPYADKGHYNDPDMLEVGNGKLTYEQNKSHFSLWCMMNAPLILGNDLRKFLKEDGSADEGSPVLKLVKNEKLIALDRDPLGKPCKRVKKGCVDVLVKPLEDGFAVCFFNKTNRKKRASFDVHTLAGDPYLRIRTKDTYSVEDLWTNETTTTSGRVACDLPPCGVVVYKLS